MDPEDNRRGWAERSGAFSPEYYAEIGPNEVSETLAAVFDHYIPETATVLELGCGSGRHLEHLRKQGYTDLSGIDINDTSFEVMAEHYPKLTEIGTFHTGSIEEILPDMDDGAFDVIYSVETLQHVHPDDEWVFEEIARVTDDFVITAENEGNSPNRGRNDAKVSQVHDEFPLYHRNWRSVFTDLGLAHLIEEPGKRDTVRVFRIV